MLKEKYSEVFESILEMEDNWVDWFNPDIPSDISFPDDTEFSFDVAIAMLDAGETYWSHPGWIQDVAQAIEDWASKGRLIRVRLTAAWLLTTLPLLPMDEEFVVRLQLMATGDFCGAFVGEFSIYPRLPEFYLQTLNWKMVSSARAAMQRLCPKAMEWME